MKLATNTTRKRALQIAGILAVGFPIWAIAGCSNDVDSAEDVGEAIDDAVDDAGDAVDDAIDG